MKEGNQEKGRRELLTRETLTLSRWTRVGERKAKGLLFLQSHAITSKAALAHTFTQLLHQREQCVWVCVCVCVVSAVVLAM